VAALLGTEALTGADATKISLAAAESPIVVHLATHGIFLPAPEPPPAGDYYQRLYVVRVPGEGDYVMGAENDLPEAQGRPGLPGTQADPLLRSAVALAGLNAWLNGVMPPPEAGIGMLTTGLVVSISTTQSGSSIGSGGLAPPPGSWGQGAATEGRPYTSLGNKPDTASA